MYNKRNFLCTNLFSWLKHLPFEMGKDGLVIVYTGNGKGKTTAALGMALRAIGYNHKICMIQFIKGSWPYGEMESAKRLKPELKWVVSGIGLVIIKYVLDLNNFKPANLNLVLTGNYGKN